MTDSPYKVAVGPDTFMVNYKFVDEEGKLTGESLPDPIVDQLDSWQKGARKEHVSIPTSLIFLPGQRRGGQSIALHPSVRLCPLAVDALFR